TSRLLTLVVHELAPERVLGRVLVVGPTAQTHALYGRLASARKLFYMVPFEHRARRTALADFAHERAPAAVSLPDLASHVRRHIALAGSRGPARTWLLGCRELALLEVHDECAE